MESTTASSPETSLSLVNWSPFGVRASCGTRSRRRRVSFKKVAQSIGHARTLEPGARRLSPVLPHDFRDLRPPSSAPICPRPSSSSDLGLGSATQTSRLPPSSRKDCGRAVKSLLGLA